MPNIHVQHVEPEVELPRKKGDPVVFQWLNYRPQVLESQAFSIRVATATFFCLVSAPAEHAGTHEIVKQRQK